MTEKTKEPDYYLPLNIETVMLYASVPSRTERRFMAGLDSEEGLVSEEENAAEIAESFRRLAEKYPEFRSSS